MVRFIGNEDRDEFEKTLKLNHQAYSIKELYKQNFKDIIDQVLDNVSPPASIDLLISTITNHINLFAYLYGATDKSKTAVEFIRKYLGQVDKRYEKLGGLLYHMLRNGYAHRACAKRVKLDAGNILDFEYGFDDKHLVINKTQDSLLLKISLPVFCSDLLRAIDLYAEDVNNDPSLCKNFDMSFQNLRQAEEETELRRKRRLDQDFDHIRTLLT